MASRSQQRAFEGKLATVLRAERRFTQLQREQKLPLEHLHALQRERAIAMARFAATQSPFYRELYARAGIRQPT